jgi:hypothetical protein
MSFRVIWVSFWTGLNPVVDFWIWNHKANFKASIILSLFLHGLLVPDHFHYYTVIIGHIVKWLKCYGSIPQEVGGPLLGENRLVLTTGVVSNTYNTRFPCVWCHSICFVPAIIVSCPPLSSLLCSTHSCMSQFGYFAISPFGIDQNLPKTSFIMFSSFWVELLGTTAVPIQDCVKQIRLLSLVLKERETFFSSRSPYLFIVLCTRRSTPLFACLYKGKCTFL